MHARRVFARVWWWWLLFHIYSYPVNAPLVSSHDGNNMMRGCGEFANATIACTAMLSAHRVDVCAHARTEPHACGTEIAHRRETRRQRANVCVAYVLTCTRPRRRALAPERFERSCVCVCVMLVLKRMRRQFVDRANWVIIVLNSIQVSRNARHLLLLI